MPAKGSKQIKPIEQIFLERKKNIDNLKHTKIES